MLTLRGEDIYIERKVHPPGFYMKSNHMHPCFEIYYLLSGTRKYFINHSFYTLRPFDMMLIRGGDLHHTTYLTDSEHERIVVYFNEHLLNQLYEQYGRKNILYCFQFPKCSVPPSEREHILALLTAMEREQNINDEYSNTILKGQLEELILLLLRLQKQNHTDDSDSLEDTDITMTARYICANFKKDLTLEDVAQIANISPTYFSKKFKQTTGFGFKEYLNTIRLKEAARILIESDNTITEVALACGFNDSNYFGDLFKKVYKVSPRTFRKTNRQNQITN